MNVVVLTPASGGVPLQLEVVCESGGVLGERVRQRIDVADGRTSVWLPDEPGATSFRLLTATGVEVARVTEDAPQGEISMEPPARQLVVDVGVAGEPAELMARLEGGRWACRADGVSDSSGAVRLILPAEPVAEMVVRLPDRDRVLAVPLIDGIAPAVLAVSLPAPPLVDEGPPPRAWAAAAVAVVVLGVFIASWLPDADGEAVRAARGAIPAAVDPIMKLPLPARPAPNTDPDGSLNLDQRGAWHVRPVDKESSLEVSGQTVTLAQATGSASSAWGCATLPAPRPDEVTVSGTWSSRIPGDGVVRLMTKVVMPGGDASIDDITKVFATTAPTPFEVSIALPEGALRAALCLHLKGTGSVLRVDGLATR